MPLVTNSEGKQLYVIYRVSDGAIIARNKIHFSLDETQQPTDGTLYLKMDTDVVPDYDSRVYDLVKTEEKIDLIWKATWATPKRAVTDIKTAVTNRENIELFRHVREYEREKLEILGLAVLFQLQSGVVLNARQTAIKNKVLGAATKLFQNDTRAAELFTAIDANQVPDIDAGWAAE
jgi:hypothetical protein